MLTSPRSTPVTTLPLGSKTKVKAAMLEIISRLTPTLRTTMVTPRRAMSTVFLFEPQTVTVMGAASSAVAQGKTCCVYLFSAHRLALALMSYANRMKAGDSHLACLRAGTGAGLLLAQQLGQTGAAHLQAGLSLSSRMISLNDFLRCRWDQWLQQCLQFQRCLLNQRAGPSQPFETALRGPYCTRCVLHQECHHLQGHYRPST